MVTRSINLIGILFGVLGLVLVLSSNVYAETSTPQPDDFEAVKGQSVVMENAPTKESPASNSSSVQLINNPEDYKAGIHSFVERRLTRSTREVTLKGMQRFHNETQWLKDRVGRFTDSEVKEGINKTSTVGDIFRYLWGEIYRVPDADLLVQKMKLLGHNQGENFDIWHRIAEERFRESPAFSGFSAGGPGHNHQQSSSGHNYRQAGPSHTR